MPGHAMSSRTLGIALSGAFIAVSLLAGAQGRSAPATQTGAPKFAPGGQELFALDFASAPTGGFRGSEAVRVVSGKVDVVDKDGMRMLRASNESELLIRLPRQLNLPESFTIEVDIIPKESGPQPDLTLEGTATMNRGAASAHILWNADGNFGNVAVIGGNTDIPEFPIPDEIRITLPGVLTRVGLSVEGNTIRMFNNGRDVREGEPPIKARFGRSPFVRMSLGGVTDETSGEVSPVYLARLRIATGAPVVASNQQAMGGTGDQPRSGPPGPPDPNQPRRGSGDPVPNAIANLTVTDSPAGPVVNWLGVPSAVYTVHRWLLSDPQCCSNTSPASPALVSPPWQDSPLPVTGTYVYKVTSQTSSGSTTFAETQFEYTRAGGGLRIPDRTQLPDRTQMIPPSLPVTVTPTQNGPVVTWPSMPNATAYAVGRWKTDDPNCCNNSSGRGFAATSPWQDQPLPMTGVYTYRVIAQTPTGDILGETQFAFRAMETPTYTAIPAATPTATATPIAAPTNPLDPTRPTSVSAAPAPTNLTATGNPVSVMLQWSQVPGATRYSVSRAVTGTTSWVSLPAPAAGPASSAPAYADAIPNPNDTYTYRVTAYQADGGAGTASVDFKPPVPTDPTQFTATETGPGTVQFVWNPVMDVTSYLISGPSTGTGITAFLKLDNNHRSSYTLTGVPAGTHTWTIASSWQPGGVLTPSNAWPTATATVSVGATGSRYRLVLLGFEVEKQSKENTDTRDGNGDEAYFSAIVNQSSLTGLPLPVTKTPNVSFIQTRTFGDEAVSVPYGRIKGGTASLTGGFKTGDILPPTLDLMAATGSTTQQNQFPMLVWEGTLADGGIVVVHPTLWEDDVNPIVHANWMKAVLDEAAVGYRGSAAGLTAILDQVRPMALSYNYGGELFECTTEPVDLARRPCEAHGVDRPIGLLHKENAGGYLGVWKDKFIALTRANLEESLRPISHRVNGRPALPGTFSFGLPDLISWAQFTAKYTLWFRVERVP